MPSIFWPVPVSETLINNRLSNGDCTSVEDVQRRAPEAQEAEESWTDEEGRTLWSGIEEGYLQAERGDLTDGAQARREIQAMTPRRFKLSRGARKTEYPAHPQTAPIASRTSKAMAAISS